MLEKIRELLEQLENNDDSLYSFLFFSDCSGFIRKDGKELFDFEHPEEAIIKLESLLSS